MIDVERSQKELLADVISSVENGDSLKKACAKEGIKTQTFTHYLRSDKEAAVAYARAIEIRADLMADEIIEIADTATDAAKARNQIDARKWVASKHYAKRYGERIDVNVTMQLDINAALEEAQSRLLPIRDLTNTIDAQVIDISNRLEQSETDTISVGRANDALAHDKRGE